MKKTFFWAVAVFFLLVGTNAFSGDLECYGYTSTTSHFACGTHGNCVWWVAHMRSDIAAVVSSNSTLGWNAGRWYDNLRGKGFDVGSEPRIGAVVEFSKPGHVAYATNLGANGSFNVSEMDYYGTLGSGNGVQYATYSPNSDGTYNRNGTGKWTLKGFIYGKTPETTQQETACIGNVCWSPKDVSCEEASYWYRLKGAPYADQAGASICGELNQEVSQIIQSAEPVKEVPEEHWWQSWWQKLTSVFGPSASADDIRQFVVERTITVINDNPDGQYVVTKDEENNTVTVINPLDSESSETDPGQISGDYGKVTMSTPSKSSSRPELYGKELKFKDEKTKYYDDETTKVVLDTKNVGINAPNVDIKVKLFRFEGEKENGDTKEVGEQNIKGTNLKHNQTKSEEFQFGAPDDEDVYQFYALVDTKNVAKEANEKNNRIGNIRCRVHKRPNVHVSELTLDDGRATFDQAEFVKGKVTFTNAGGEPFVDVSVRWYLDGIHIGDDNMRHWNIEKGDEKHEDIYVLIPSTPGIHTFKACAELDADRDKSDNCKELSFEVTPALEQSIEVPPAPDKSLRADVDGNGIIDNDDVDLIMQKSMGNDMSQTPWIDSPITGDADCNGVIATRDALLVSRKVSGMSMEGTGSCLDD